MSLAPIVEFQHVNKRTVPTMVPDIPRIAVDTEHPFYLTLSERVQGIVAIEGIGFSNCQIWFLMITIRA